MSFILTVLTITALNGVWTYEDNNTIELGIYTANNKSTLLLITPGVTTVMNGKISKEGDLYTLMFAGGYSDADAGCQERIEIALSGEIIGDFEGNEYLDTICVVMFVKRCPGKKPSIETKELSGKWKKKVERK